MANNVTTLFIQQINTFDTGRTYLPEDEGIEYTSLTGWMILNYFTLALMISLLVCLGVMIHG